jgi:hypothetical protein
MQRMAAAVAVSLSLQLSVMAQVPQPFPRTPPRPAPSAPAPSAPAPAEPAPVVPVTAAPDAAQPAGSPTEATLGFPIYPTAQFITSYDAGKGQRYYLFGVTASFSDLVRYYQSVLKTKGTLVFETPATQVFEMGKFREETMAFPPGVTVKDYTWGGTAGYLNPDPKGTPQRFPSIIQIVPAPAASR